MAQREEQRASVGADQVLEDLARLSEQDGQALMATIAPAMSRRASELRGTLAARAMVRAEMQDKAGGKDSRFVNLQEAAYGMVADFFRGLEVVGVPHSRIFEEMCREFTEKGDSETMFVSWNSGARKTTPWIEWFFVVEPFEPDSVCAGQPPSGWVKRYYDYGNRVPMRLQVFLHATRATRKCATGAVVVFGDYKQADSSLPLSSLPLSFEAAGPLLTIAPAAKAFFSLVVAWRPFPPRLSLMAWSFASTSSLCLCKHAASSWPWAHLPVFLQ